MRKLALALCAIIVLVAISRFTPSLTAWSQNTQRFEYLQVSRYAALEQRQGQPFRNENAGLRACVAGNNDWMCRDFPSNASGGALRSALATLGGEGWELVSVVDPQVPSAYLFKRQVQ